MPERTKTPVLCLLPCPLTGRCHGWRHQHPQWQQAHDNCGRLSGAADPWNAPFDTEMSWTCQSWMLGGSTMVVCLVSRSRCPFRSHPSCQSREGLLGLDHVRLFCHWAHAKAVCYLWHYVDNIQCRSSPMYSFRLLSLLSWLQHGLYTHSTPALGNIQIHVKMCSVVEHAYSSMGLLH